MKRIAVRSSLLPIIIGCFVVTGLFMMMAGRAAVMQIADEPEQGRISPPAQKVADTSASAGQAVRFSGAGQNFVALRALDMEQGGTWFDGINGSVVADTSRAYKGNRSSKVTVSASTINRGWIFADPSDYCKGVLAPVGAERWIGAAAYIADPAVHRNTRLMALSYNPSQCIQNGGSIIAVNLDQGHVYLKAYEYQSGGNPTMLSPGVPVAANQWVYVQIGLRISRDGTGWGELVVNGKSYGRISGQTLKTTYGDYNQIQLGGGWSEAGTPTTQLWLDDVYFSASRRE